MKKRNQCSILFFDLPIRRTFFTPIRLPIFTILVLMPRHKIFCRCSTGSIKYFIWIDSHNQLSITKKMWNIFFPPITNILINTFHYIYTRFFAFDNYHRTSKFSIWTLNLKFICHLKNIIFYMFKINIIQVKRLSCSIRKFFFQTFTSTN